MQVASYIAYFIGAFLSLVFVLLITIPKLFSSSNGPLPAFRGESNSLFAFIAIRQLFIGLSVTGMALMKNQDGLLLIYFIGLSIPVSDLIDGLVKKKKGLDGILINLFFIVLVLVAIVYLVRDK